MKKIFVKSVNWVGDAVMVTPALAALRRAFPNAHITLLARPVIAEVFEASPDIDEVWTANERASMRDFLSVVRRIRRKKFDLGIALPNSSRSALLLFLGGVKKRLGYNRDGRGLWLNHKINPTEEILAVHEVHYYLNLLRDFCDPAAQETKLVVPPAPDTPHLALDILTQKGISDQRPLIGLSPGAAFGTAKRWLPERFAAIADHVTEKWNAQVAIFGTPGERDVAQEIASLAKAPITIMSGEFPLRVFIAMMDHLALFVTNDSGSMHLAAARDVPIVAIFGPTKCTNTAPWHPNAIILRKDKVDCDLHPCMQRHCVHDHQCMKAVSVEDVAQETDKQMEKTEWPKNAR